MADDVPKMVEDCLTQCVNLRGQLCAFYDARIVFASFCEIVSSLGASLIHTKVYPPEIVARMLSDLMADALTRECSTKLAYLSKDELVPKEKQ